MITKRDTEAGCDRQDSKYGQVQPINAEIPQVKRHSGQCEKECTDQERTRRPINAIGRNSKNQVSSFFCSELGRPHSSQVTDHSSLQEIGRPRMTSCLVQLWTLPQCTQVNF